MSSKGSFPKQHSVTIMVALIGVIGSFVGAYMGTKSSEDIWVREKLFQTRKDFIDKRISLIQEISKSNVDAQRVAMIMDFIDTEKTFLETSVAICKKTTPNKTCKTDFKPTIDLNSANKEVAELQAKYFSNLLLANIYFCDKTQAAIHAAENQHKNWWEYDRQTQENITNAMVSEIQCGVNFQSKLKLEQERR